VKDKISNLLIYFGITLTVMGGLTFIMGVVAFNNGSFAGVGLFLGVPGGILLYGMLKRSGTENELDNRGKNRVKPPNITPVQVSHSQTSNLDPYRKFLKDSSYLQTTKQKGDALENLCLQMFANRGLAVEKVGGSGDRGLDLLLTDPDPITGGKSVVQCKHQKDKVPEEVVQRTFGILGTYNAHKAIVITTSEFTKNAKQFAEANRESVVLIDGDELHKMVIEHIR